MWPTRRQCNRLPPCWGVTQPETHLFGRSIEGCNGPLAWPEIARPKQNTTDCAGETRCLRFATELVRRLFYESFATLTGCVAPSKKLTSAPGSPGVLPVGNGALIFPPQEKGTACGLVEPVPQRGLVNEYSEALFQSRWMIYLPSHIIFAEARILQYNKAYSHPAREFTSHEPLRGFVTAAARYSVHSQRAASSATTIDIPTDPRTRK